MRVRLSDDKRDQIVDALVGFYSDAFDEKLSPFRAGEVVDFMLRQIGPGQYNQAIADARKYFLDKLEELDIEFSEPEQ